ncbi:rab-GTPase-TBC domain-containing protein [Crepidotus variabilis]|uniref:Rab-GTPase-TBC domain-containing protein n=1 Tax=Crepidotus variabilis TaxID=179855 RepID=A0A9P6EN76_9AGAR|nr:rab-GTPase-TBC domain-containing protein [Crepidotus variabilis]
MSVSGRSLAWKLFLAKEEPLQAALPPRASILLGSLRESRKKYADFLEEKSRAPDGKPAPTPVQCRTGMEDGGLIFNNPLSLHDENPWNQYFTGLELRKVISQDVERTFPEIAFFREAEVQDQLTNILFLYSTMHPSIGYRQGMHELLAPLYYAVRYDALDDGDLDDASGQYKILHELCFAEQTAADSWALFNFVMNGVSKWYEWRPAIGDPVSPFPNAAIISDGQNGMQPYTAPIVHACNYIQTSLLQACDPLLYQSLQKAGIEPQMYGIRWLRLLFTREFSMPDSLKLWDGLFACDASLELAQWVCVSMLIRIRNELIPADYSGQLTSLLRYPPPPDIPMKIEGAPHHAILLLRQALALQLASNPDTGTTIIMENRTLLNIPVEIPISLASSPRRRNLTPRQQSSSSTPHQLNGGFTRTHGKQPSGSSVAISDFTRGLYERGESLGLNKTLMNAVSEIRRNIPELAASLGVKTPTQTHTSFPLLDERPAEERPPWEPKARFEIEREVSDIRLRDKTLGVSLAWVVDTLLQDETDVKDVERMKLQKREALESLAYVRDVLMSSTMELEEDRLIGREEQKRRKLKLQKEQEDRQAATAAAMLNLPLPAPVTEGRLKHSASAQQIRRKPAPTPTSPARSSFHTPPTGNPRDVSERAPWNYTRSSFATPTSAIPPPVMPRPPPPTSTGFRRETTSKTDQTPPRTEGYLDPLGALR